jgi:hypothetical protein
MKNLNSLDQWAQSHHEVEYEYALGLFDPRSKICTRIPNPMPIATATAQQKGAVTIALNAAGYGAFALIPTATNLLAYSTAVGLISDTTAISIGTSTAVVSTMTNTVCEVKRVVSAWLGAADLSPVLSKTGTVTYGSMSFKQVQDVNCTADTFRDSLWTAMHTSQEIVDYTGGFYIPADPSCLIFSGAGIAPTGEFDVPVLYFSGCVANANVAIQYCVNFEYVPLVGQTDLLEVQLGPLGNDTEALLHGGKMRKERHNSGVDPREASKPGWGAEAYAGVATLTKAAYELYSSGFPKGTKSTFGRVSRDL